MEEGGEPMAGPVLPVRSPGGVTSPGEWSVSSRGQTPGAGDHVFPGPSPGGSTLESKEDRLSLRRRESRITMASGRRAEDEEWERVARERREALLQYGEPVPRQGTERRPARRPLEPLPIAGASASHGQRVADMDALHGIAGEHVKPVLPVHFNPESITGHGGPVRSRFEDVDRDARNMQSDSVLSACGGRLPAL